MGLGVSALPQIAEALEQLASTNAPVLWLQGLSCSGCSVSFLNSEDPDPAQLLTGHISLLFHSTISAAGGTVAMDIIHRSIDQGGYYLVIEGSIPLGMPQACTVGGEPLSEQAAKAARSAKAVIAAGTCASYGGIPAAQNNPTGAVSVPHFLNAKAISTPVISLPGCPIHPDWLIGTLIHVIKFGFPPLDDKGRPKMFYSRLIHDQCPRFADYERERFAASFSEDGCFFKLGCLGPLTHADCTVRQWNSGTNFCIKAGSPCIGCASEQFASKAEFPFFQKRVTPDTGGKS
jgi:hydrogenase small subunit